MKKAVALIICILFILSLGGCSGSFPIASHTGVFALPAGSTLPSVASSTAVNESAAPAASGFSFRKTNWGMTPDQVIASEGRQPDASDGTRISYVKKHLFDKECTLFYIFAQGKLLYAGYDFAEKSLGTCVSDYKDIVSGITDQYVSPTDSEVLWSNGTFKSDPKKYGLAVLLGDVSYQTVWNVNQAQIGCQLHATANDSVKSVSVTVTWQAPPVQKPAPTETASTASASPSETTAPPSASSSASASAPPSAPEATGTEFQSPEPPASMSDNPTVPPSTGFSFRNTNWGMAEDAVVSSEGRQADITSADSLTYRNQTFLNRDCNLFYVFDNGSLQTGGYDISEDSDNPSGSIADYNTIVAALTQQCGAPASAEQLWNNTPGNPDGLAVSAGNLVYRSVWTGQATINCILYGYGTGSQKKTAITVSYQNPVASSAVIDTPPGYSFRKTNWGMSINQVIASEGRQPDEKGDNYLIYKKEKFHNADCHIIYQFNESGLASGTYMIYSLHINPDDYVGDYNTAVSILAQSYGPPSASNKAWNPTSRLKDDPRNYGIAVLRGDLSLSSEWASHQAAISCSLSLANSIVAVAITYNKPAQ